MTPEPPWPGLVWSIRSWNLDKVPRSDSRNGKIGCNNVTDGIFERENGGLHTLPGNNLEKGALEEEEEEEEEE